MSRISPGTLIVLIFAVLFGLVGAYAVRRQLAQKPVEEVVEAPAPGPTIVRIPLAARDLEPGRPIELTDIAMVAGTIEQLKKKFNLPVEYMSNSTQIIGRMLKEPLKKAKSFRPDQFYPNGTGPSVAERLKPGYRAVTIDVEGSGAINGFATPASVVDVLFRSEGDEEHSPTTINLVEGVEVLALDRITSPGTRGGDQLATVTLAVTAVQANALKITEGRGTFSLALRNPNDNSLAVSTGPQTLEDLLNLPDSKKPFEAEIYRGSSRTTVAFPNRRPRQSVKVTTPIRIDDAPADEPAKQ